jgi:phage gp37-like protein
MPAPPFPGEFAPDITWTAIQALLSAQLGNEVDVDCIGEDDFDEQGDITIKPPAARVLFLDEVSRGALDPQNRSYNVDQAFAVICAAENYSSVQTQRIATLQLADQVKHLLVGARLALPDGSAGGDRTEPILYAGMSPLPTSDLGMAYVAKFVIPNIAQFAAPNAYPNGGS